MMVTRRQCLGGTAGALFPRLALRADAAPARPVLVVHSYVWTQQLRTRKTSLTGILEEMSATTAGAGFKNMELMSSFVEANVHEQTVAAMARHGLKAPIVYAGGPLHEAASAEKVVERILATADAAKAAGAVAINCNPDPKPNRERKTDEELNTQAQFLNQIGQELRRRDMRLFVHHHDSEMADDAREWKHVLANTDPKVVWLCVDAEWAFHAGQDPLALVRAAGKRLASLHMRNSNQRVWMESFGEGDIDYRAVAGYLKKTRSNPYLVVELAYAKETVFTRPLPENLRLSRGYAEKIFGV